MGDTIDGLKLFRGVRDLFERQRAKNLGCARDRADMGRSVLRPYMIVVGAASEEI
jgi:hypothetical protein